MQQPLLAECDAFIRAVVDGTPSGSDGATGVAVVRALDAATRSMANEGRLTPLSSE
jgi:predicted dehydrogenase